ncbi:helix-turn-helix domain-containing protein (plasmid) [Streptomyces cynarae]|uniref:Helix-turn-helix domain-containing protein n=1 Tax=Streptomyces cynarae TaxID=2981134 RepID=A0ABY6EJL2_9ACTN|nr:helix-turn-helix domain-containing protein [Streptomyces cynarae]UXY24913.1 helix-turn-helix domain-containing protein [Streptomyces cynarae]
MAIAHPLRLRILEAVALQGPLTATEVAQLVDESPANCSWHLRQLNKYGFIAEVEGRRGRQRPWRMVVDAHRWGTGEESSELARAGDAAAQVLIELEYRALREWLATRRRGTPEWRDAGFFNQAVGWCTPDELNELRAAVTELFAPYLLRIEDPAARPEGSRPVRLMGWGIPAEAPLAGKDTEEEARE